MNFLLNHLWQSSIFALGIAALCLALRKNAARSRYWLWLAASLKFLVPFSLLVSLGQRIERPTQEPVLQPDRVQRVAAVYSPVDFPVFTGEPTGSRQTSPPWFFLWLLGTVLVTTQWIQQWKKLSAIRKTARQLPMDFPVPALVTEHAVEPGILGVFRPVLLIPETLMDSLTPTQWRAVLEHERCHVRCHDNLSAALHNIVITVFWFHPLVWWIGNRLLAERERACDESVLAAGEAREEYAQSILQVCKLNLYQSAHLAAISGADLRTRIIAIMSQPLPMSLTWTRKAAVAAVTLTAIATPLLVGILQGQTSTDSYKFEVASIRPADTGHRGTSINTGALQFITRNSSLVDLIRYSYAIQSYQLSGGPSWISEDRYDVTAKYESAEADAKVSELSRLDSRDGRIRARVRHMLAERFQLKMREELKELPVYVLVQDKGGHKLKRSENAKGGMNHNSNNGNGTITGNGVTTKRLAIALGGVLGRPVNDETGLENELVDFELKYFSDTAADSGPTIYTALREQLGLKLESRKGPVTTYVVESVARPSDN
jgi:bla regulator protein BlaR1